MYDPLTDHAIVNGDDRAHTTVLDAVTRGWVYLEQPDATPTTVSLPVEVFADRPSFDRYTTDDEVNATVNQRASDTGALVQGAMEPTHLLDFWGEVFVKAERIEAFDRVRDEAAVDDYYKSLYAMPGKVKTPVIRLDKRGHVVGVPDGINRALAMERLVEEVEDGEVQPPAWMDSPRMPVYLFCRNTADPKAGGGDYTRRVQVAP